METINLKIKQKLESYQELYDSNQKLIYIGQKIDDISEKYFNSKNKKELIAEFLKVIEIENSKRRKATAKEIIVKKEKEKEVIKEITVHVEEIRAAKKEKKLKTALLVELPKTVIKVGDRVRMFDGKSIGSIDKIEKNKATVNYGVFTSKVNLEALEFVERPKK
jgi:DNA mismatch repair protein MutS2